MLHMSHIQYKLYYISHLALKIDTGTNLATPWPGVKVFCGDLFTQLHHSPFYTHLNTNTLLQTYTTTNTTTYNTVDFH